MKTGENFETSVDYYIKALQTYQESIGKLSPSYSAVLRNLSSVYRDAALALEMPSEVRCCAVRVVWSLMPDTSVRLTQFEFFNVARKNH